MNDASFLTARLCQEFAGVEESGGQGWKESDVDMRVEDIGRQLARACPILLFLGFSPEPITLSCLVSICISHIVLHH